MIAYHTTSRTTEQILRHDDCPLLVLVLLVVPYEYSYRAEFKQYRRYRYSCVLKSRLGSGTRTRTQISTSTGTGQNGAARSGQPRPPPGGPAGVSSRQRRARPCVWETRKFFMWAQNADAFFVFILHLSSVPHCTLRRQSQLYPKERFCLPGGNIAACP
eukprot:scaffold508830_cov37-Prasinocladus_malaysianus.AAC.1